MAWDWTTFALEIANFLALLWILKRFLYRPVLATLAERQEGIDRSINEAREMEARASGLRADFESRLADWEQEKARARAGFDAELAAERVRQLESLNRDMAAERERSFAQIAHRQETLRRELAAQANREARQFASVLLARLAGADLERRLVDYFLDELSAQSSEHLAPLRAGQHENVPVAVTSAYPLAEEQRQRLLAAVEAGLGKHGPVDFVEDRNLLAGVRLSFGSWQLEFSLAGELGFFAEASHLAQ